MISAFWSSEVSKEFHPQLCNLELIAKVTPVSARLVHSVCELSQEQRGRSFDWGNQEIVSGDGSIYISHVLLNKLILCHYIMILFVFSYHVWVKVHFVGHKHDYAVLFWFTCVWTVFFYPFTLTVSVFLK